MTGTDVAIEAVKWPTVLARLTEGNDLDRDTCRQVMGAMLAEEATPAQVAGFLVALRAKGEQPDEVLGLRDQMMAQAATVDLPSNAVDIVGSGGDRHNTVNISTMAAIVAAAAGATVVKHGNRAASSASGTADCLEVLGLRIDVAPEKQPAVLDAAGIVFLFAPLYHSALRSVGPIRRELGIPTVFNTLGPLANPARPQAMALGTAQERTARLSADVLAAQGNRAVVFHGSDGMDELTTTAGSRIWLVNDGKVVEGTFDPEDVGLSRASVADLVGGDPQHNAAVVRDIMQGAPGPIRDIVTLNAAAGLLAFAGPDPDVPLAQQLLPFLEQARGAIDNGAAHATLNSWVAATLA